MSPAKALCRARDHIISLRILHVSAPEILPALRDTGRQQGLNQDEVGVGSAQISASIISTLALVHKLAGSILCLMTFARCSEL